MNDHAREVRYGLTDPARLCAALGLTDGALRQASGLLVACPVHADRTPSCSVTTGPDGTIRARCFACDWTGDALGLIAVVRGRSTRDRDGFRETLAEGANIAGLLTLEAEILDGEKRDRPPVPPPVRKPPPPYPDEAEVWALWRSATRPDEDRDASRYLVGRCIDPTVVADRGLARVIAEPLPRWASYRGDSEASRPWTETGHRLVTRAFDADGRLRGVRAIQVADDSAPKRLPPSGRRASELVLANAAAHDMLTGKAHPSKLVIVEGEPDHLTRCVLSDDACIGLVSGSWTDRFAAAIPRGCKVIIRTHHDEAGDRYARQVAESLASKDVTLMRSEAA